jgi:hypothetical protein
VRSLPPRPAKRQPDKRLPPTKARGRISQSREGRPRLRDLSDRENSARAHVAPHPGSVRAGNCRCRGLSAAAWVPIPRWTCPPLHHPTRTSGALAAVSGFVCRASSTGCCTTRVGPSRRSDKVVLTTSASARGQKDRHGRRARGRWRHECSKLACRGYEIRDSGRPICSTD